MHRFPGQLGRTKGSSVLSYIFPEAVLKSDLSKAKEVAPLFVILQVEGKRAPK